MQEGGNGPESEKLGMVMTIAPNLVEMDAIEVASRNTAMANKHTSNMDGRGKIPDPALENEIGMPRQIPGVDYDTRYWRPSCIIPNGLVWLGIIPAPDANTEEMSASPLLETSQVTLSMLPYPMPSQSDQPGASKDTKGKGRVWEQDTIEVDKAQEDNPGQVFSQLPANAIAEFASTSREEQEMLFQILRESR